VAKYKVQVGLDYPTPKGKKRAEPGECVDDLPKKSLEWLLRQGCVKSCGDCGCETEGGDD
jgi:hypothetical protein